ncbi:MAG: tetratricopeptide repeat protein [Deltaproteobacteria bacterium]|nr:tetratricopeptide repeat protein [Deltaproteobacteria bacterium]
MSDSAIRALGVPGATIRTPLVGRGRELRELEDALARALSNGEPQTVTLIGGPGIGKSRLLHEFVSRVSERERRVRIYRAACQESGSSFGPFSHILRARFGILEGADSASTRASFRAMVEEALGDRRVDEFVHYLGAFLGLDLEGSPFVQALEEDPAQAAVVGRAVLRRFLELDARDRPMVLAFEDLHWAHDDSLELLRYLTASLRGCPVLIVATARPELLARRADWLDSPSHTRLELSPLSPDDAAQLMLKLLDKTGDPPEELVDAAVEMAGGSPYLLQQMLRAFFDAGVLRVEQDANWSVALDKLDDAHLPLTVEDAISARIASLTAAERGLLEKAASMGGVFWLGALVALSREGQKPPELWGGHDTVVSEYEELLETLAERDYVLPLPDSSIPGEREYAFKHNLERETLYRLTNRSRMRTLHRRVGEWLEFHGEEDAEAQIEMLAQHFEEGGAPDRAARYYVSAGDRARARYANAKASEYYARGLELLGDADPRIRVEALHHYGDVLQLAGRNDEALGAFSDMLQMAWRLDLKAKGGAAHNRIGRLYRAVGHLDQAMRHLGTGHALFDADGDRRGQASSLDDIGKVHWMRGDYGSAERFMVKALELRRELEDKRSIALSQNNLGLVYQDSGRFEEAKRAFEEALLLRQEIGDRPGIAQTLNNLGTIHQDDGAHERAVEVYDEALRVAREVGDRMRQAVILTNLGESHYRLERPQQAIEVLGNAEALSSSLGDRILEGEILRGLAKAHMLVREFAKAREYISRSIELFESARAKPFLGVAQRTFGEIASAAGWGGDDHARAKEAFERSVALFTELGNDIELAHSLDSYAAFVEQTEGDDDPVKVHEVMQLRTRADAIRERLRAAEAYALPPLEGEATHPGASNPLDEA